MSETKEDPTLGINSWLQDELAYQYKFDRSSVDEGWAELLQQAPPKNGGSVPSAPEPVAAVATAAAAVEVPAPPPTPITAAAPAPAAPPAEVATVPAPAPVPAAPPAPASTAVARQEIKTIGPGDQLVPLRGAAARIAENMTASLAIPVATSQRQIPVALLKKTAISSISSRALQGEANSASRTSSPGPSSRP